MNLGDVFPKLLVQDVFQEERLVAAIPSCSLILQLACSACRNSTLHVEDLWSLTIPDEILAGEAPRGVD